ncbi:MAG: GNAT family N-acetyltransferase [Kiritimatiellales bacterium]|nr:GNAT family N-acetyltransferase [Kiritimatiellales bacterium]
MLGAVMFIEVTTKKQIHTVARLAKEIWTEHYVPIIGKEQTEYMLNEFQSIDAITRQIQKDHCLYFLVDPEDRPIGYLAVQPREEDLLLSKIYLERASRGHGFGHKTIHFVEELARELEKPAITLTVNRYNSNSLASYSRWGFRIVDQIRTDIGGGFSMDDYVMQKKTA